ncbi:ommochrome-binding protein-like [Achroia grisella]|uniref:ommochrome-binding protein-like n=1 Tax=Achroia grisella TaxID=688607 RepID=UPI0027D31D30|nr:ommochrome-binding protein-like [Achroia grisella]
MKLLLLLLGCIISTSAKKCNGVLFDQRYYEPEILKDGLNKVRQLVYSRKDNTVYFLFNQGVLAYDGSVGYINLDTRLSGYYKGIRNATSISIDDKKNRIYIGSVDGLYAIGDRRIPEKFPLYEPIQHLFFKNVLYFTNMRNRMYSFDSDGVKVVDDMRDYVAETFVVDNDGNILFTNGKKLYKLKLGTRSSAFEIITRSITALSNDLEDRLFAASLDGIFVYNKYKYALDKMSNLHEIKALTFNNMLDPIYVVFDLLVKLKNPVNCVEDDFFL